MKVNILPGMKKKLSIALILASFTILSCQKFRINTFISDWHKSPDGAWTGADCWANRLQDWRIKDGRLECTGTMPFRTVHLMSGRISEKNGNLNTSITIFRDKSEMNDGGSSAGILLGAGRGLDQRAAALVFHSPGEGAGIYAGIDERGNLFLKDIEKSDYFIVRNDNNNKPWTEVRLMLSVITDKESARIKILAINPYTNFITDRLEAEGIPSERVSGNIAIAANYPDNTLKYSTYAFSDWKVWGSRLEKNTSWKSGPIVTAQYTLSKNILKLTAQFMPLGDNDMKKAVLQIFENEEWTDISSSEVLRPSYTANFKIPGWNRIEDTEYRIVYEIKRTGKQRYFLSGIIKHDPVEKPEIKILSLSCIEQIIRPDGDTYRSLDDGRFNYRLSLLFPHNQLVMNLKSQNADLLYFAGDQVYETASPVSPDPGNPFLDYLYKWYLWCITYRDLTTTIPAITIPDDHDVYHGNLWGEGGRPTPPGLFGNEAQDAGGYKMPSDFVNMVQTTQTSHLPDPVDPESAGQGISVYFTECNTGGVSIAVLEDRKFKSAPKNLFPEAKIQDGWPLNRFWNPKYNARTENALLLGNRQMKFLESWIQDWSGKTWMKIVASQTLFANLATIPSDSLTDEVVPLMPIPDSGEYVSGDRLATDFDSDGWPQNERDRVLRLIRKAFALHISGDQHLGSTVQYGIDDFRDAGFAIVSPATGNIWPRHWFPPIPGFNRKPGWPENFGDFEDGFGNRITVFAVANPQKSKIEPVRHHEASTGYSVITLRRDTREIELANWPYHSGQENGKPFPYWPVKINQTDNYGKPPAGWLPEIKVEGMNDPVIRIIREYTGELIYTLRIKGNSFQPWIFEYGNYRIEVGDPDQNRWQKIEKVYPTAFREREPVNIKF